MALSDEEALRKAVLVPCEAKEDLRAWIDYYLDLDFPDTLVDPDSTTTPFEAIWSLYDRMRTNSDPDLDQEMWYAARDSFKSLGAAVLEVLVLLHLHRDVGHMAAQESQALNVQRYVKQAFQRPFLRDYLVSDNVTKVEVRWYENVESQDTMTPAEWKAGFVREEAKWRQREYSIQIVPATMRGANSLHVPFLCVTGDTEVSVPAMANSALGVRARQKATARGLFRRLSGRKAGGRPGPEGDPSGVNFEVSDEPENRILSMDLDTGAIEFRRITHAHARLASVSKVSFEGGAVLRCTPDEPVFVWGRGFIEVKDLRPGDEVLQLLKGQTGTKPVRKSQASYVSGPAVEDPVDSWDQVVLGSLLGDGGVYPPPGGRLGNPYFQERHCLEQAEYLAWKRSVIQNKLRTVDLSGAVSGYTGEPQVGFRTGQTPLLTPYLRFKQTLEGVERLGPLGLAVWYMDDGCEGSGVRFSSESFTLSQNERLAELLSRKFGIEVSVRDFEKRGKKYYYLQGGVEAKRRLNEACRRHVHPTMAYKFDTEANRSKCTFCGSEFWHYELGTCRCHCDSIVCAAAQSGSVRRLKVRSVEPAGEEWVYDFTVEGNHNFFAGGVLVKNCVDEVDIAPPEAYQEAKNIPTEREGHYPVTLLVSTRKSSFGLVQKEIDEAPNSGLKIKHWNIFETSTNCEDSRHRPDLPHVQLYVDDDALHHLSEKDFQLLPQEKKDRYRRVEGFGGCEKCPIFSSCLGNLAKVKVRKTKLHKSTRTVIGKFRKNTHDMRVSQLLCRAPQSGGLIYPHLDRDVHLVTAAQIAELIDGEERVEVPGQPFTKADLLALMRSLADGKFVAGLDHGFGHNFAVTSFFKWGQYAFVFDCQSQSELELDDKVRLLNETVKGWDPEIWPDTSEPGSNKTIRRAGFNVHLKWDKGKGSVKAGIDIVRTKLRPLTGKPTLYFLRGDPGVELLVDRMSKYHWKKDAAGNYTAEPDKVDDDEPDSARYGLMNEFWGSNKVGVAPEVVAPEEAKPKAQYSQPTTSNYLTHFIQQAVGVQVAEGEPVVQGSQAGKSKTGRFKWDLS